MAKDLEGLEAERRRLYARLSEVGDFRRGSIAENYRKCGKSNCGCSDPDHPGHGPQYLLMTKVQGRSRARNLRTGSEVEKTRREVANHLGFRRLVQEVVDVNEQICAARPLEFNAQEGERAAAKKKSPQSSKRKSHARSSA